MGKVTPTLVPPPSRDDICGLAAELHGQPADQRQAEAAADVGPDRAARSRAVVLDDQLDHAGLVARLDADLGRGDAVEAAVERAAHRLGHDQADGNGDVGADRHDRRADVVARLRPVGAAPSDRDLPHQVADELLEVDQRPARALVEMAMQDRQREHAILGVAEEAADARRADLAGLQVEQARDHLQVVLHPVMDLAQHMVALLEAGPQLRLAAGDRLGHRLDALAHRRQFGRPRRVAGASSMSSPRATRSAKSWM